MVRRNVFEILKHSKNVTKEDFCEFAEENGIKGLGPDMVWKEIEEKVRLDARVNLSDIRKEWPEEFDLDEEEKEEEKREEDEQEEKVEKEEAKKEGGEKQEEKTEEEERGEPEGAKEIQEKVEIIKEEEIEEERGFFDRVKEFFNGIIGKIFGEEGEFKLGIYGPTNVGKTTLANRISKEWVGEEVGEVSAIPHETREIQQKENVVIQKEGRKLDINLVDTPGIATRVDFEEFLDYGFEENDAKDRAKEATQGIIESIRWLDSMDVVLAVMDATKDPMNQVNLTILGNLEARGIPVLVVANKLDKEEANLERIKAAFPQYNIVGISAKEGLRTDKLYEKIFKVTGK